MCLLLYNNHQKCVTFSNISIQLTDISVSIGLAFPFVLTDPLAL